MVQDDVVFSKNVRQHVERCWRPSLGSISPMELKGWLNLFTFDLNEQVIAAKPLGTWHESAELIGSGKKGRQCGKGALAYVFSNQGVEALLSHPTMIAKCRSSRPRTGVDGAVTDAMNAMGWREWVSNPSLCDHIGGDCSVIDKQIDAEVKSGNRPHVRPGFPKCQTFSGTEFDCLSLPVTR